MGLRANAESLGLTEEDLQKMGLYIADVKNGVTTIYNKSNPNGFILEEPFVEFKEMTKNADVTLDDHHYFVMGDNRAQSYDSRDWGQLDEVNIKGQVLFRVYPFKQAGYEPGRYSFTK
jgi:signal peptidase I